MARIIMTSRERSDKTPILFQILINKLQYEEFRKSVQGRRDYEANLLHTTQEESFAFLRTIPYKKHLVMNPDRFKTAFKIRFKLP
jgi:hypothetical protein